MSPLLLKRPKQNPFSFLFLVHRNGSGDPPTRPAKILGSGTGTRQPAVPLRPPPLPLPRSPNPNPDRGLFRPLLQAPPLLPRPQSLSPPFPPQMPPNLNPTRSFSSDSECDADADLGQQPDLPPTPAAELERVCKVIDELFASNRNMEAVLDELAVDLSSSLVVSVLDRFKHAHKPAYRFFRWAGLKPGFSYDPATCLKMLSVLGKTKQFESMVDLLEEMGEKGLLSMDAFKVSIKAFASAREMKKAVEVLRMMKRFDFDAGIDDFNCLIDSLVKAKLAKEADELVERMKDQFEVNLRTYSMILYGYCKVKNLFEAGRIWNEMLDKGFKPDIAAYNIMLQGLIGGQRRPEAIKLFELMKAKGPDPNSRTYTILIQDLCKAGKMERAVACFKEMIDSGCAPDVATYTCLIVGFGNARHMDKVSGLLREMTEKGCPPDGRTYNALIKLMTNRRMSEDAARIYKKMIKCGFEPTVHSYNMLMKCYFRCKSYDMGCAIWDEMRSKGTCPDVNSYTVFIEGHIRHGRVDVAYKYIEEMMNKGMKLPQIDYNKFAAELSRARKPDVLSELAQKMKFSGNFEASEVLNDWAERNNKGFKGRIPSQTGERLF